LEVEPMRIAIIRLLVKSFSQSAIPPLLISQLLYVLHWNIYIYPLRQTLIRFDWVLRHTDTVKVIRQITEQVLRILLFVCLLIVLEKTRIKINKAKATFTWRSPRHTQVGHPEGTKQKPGVEDSHYIYLDKVERY
jgi:hypothetical protein